MMSLSLLLNCGIREPQDALGILGIAREDVSSYAGRSPEFLSMQRNGALVSAASGAFTHVADVFLYDCDPSKTEELLLVLSRQGVDVAMPVLEDADPEVHWYWHQGERRMLRVVDIEGKLELVDPLAEHGLGALD